MSPKLTKHDKFGSLFQVQLDRAKYLVDDVYADSLLLVNSVREAMKDDEDDNAFIFTTQEDVSLKWAVEEPTTMSSVTVPTPLFQPSSHVP